MSRFTLTTIIAIIAGCLTLIVPGRAASLMALAGVWLIYLSICAIGMGRIRVQFYCPAICRGPVGHRRVALTFDDGPDPNSTPAVLDLLNREKISAAFFCIGKNVDAYPQLAARIVAEGHLLENHTYNHPWWISCLTSRPLTDEMARTQQSIQQATGITPRYFRSPAGLTNHHFPKALRRSGLTLVGWDVRPFDTSRNSKDVIDRILRKTRDGSIILLHDGGMPAQQITSIVIAAIAKLRARGLEFERLDRLIEHPAGSATKETTQISGSVA